MYGIVFQNKDKCAKCYVDLTYKEIKAKEDLCVTCKEKARTEAHRKAMGKSIGDANRRSR